MPPILDADLDRWLRWLVAAVNEDNLTPDAPCGRSRTARTLAEAPPGLRGHAALAAADLAAAANCPLAAVRSDRVCRELAVADDPGRLNLVVARMTVPGGPWPGHFGLEAVVFRAEPALLPEWFPPLATPHHLHFGETLAASRGFASGSGAALFPEQLSVANRPVEQAFGVVFLDKLCALLSTHVAPLIDPGGLGFDAADEATLQRVRATAFLAHEWGHAAGAELERGTVGRRRRFAAVLSELHADLAALAMLLDGQLRAPLAGPAAQLLIFDRVVREAWLVRPHAQVDAIAARHLLHLLASTGALTAGTSGLRLDLDTALAPVTSELERVTAVLSACLSGDLQPAVDYLTAGGWRIEGTACYLDLGADLGAALSAHRSSPTTGGQAA